MDSSSFWIWGDVSEAVLLLDSLAWSSSLGDACLRSSSRRGVVVVALSPLERLLPPVDDVPFAAVAAAGWSRFRDRRLYGVSPLSPSPFRPLSLIVSNKWQDRDISRWWKAFVRLFPDRLLVRCSFVLLVHRNWRPKSPPEGNRSRDPGVHPMTKKIVLFVEQCGRYWDAIYLTRAIMVPPDVYVWWYRTLNCDKDQVVGINVTHKWLLLTYLCVGHDGGRMTQFRYTCYGKVVTSEMV